MDDVECKLDVLLALHRRRPSDVRPHTKPSELSGTERPRSDSEEMRRARRPAMAVAGRAATVDGSTTPPPDEEIFDVEDRPNYDAYNNDNGR